MERAPSLNSIRYPLTAVHAQLLYNKFAKTDWSGIEGLCENILETDYVAICDDEEAWINKIAEVTGLPLSTVKQRFDKINYTDAMRVKTYIILAEQGIVTSGYNVRGTQYSGSEGYVEPMYCLRYLARSGSFEEVKYILRIIRSIDILVINTLLKRFEIGIFTLPQMEEILQIILSINLWLLRDPYQSQIIIEEITTRSRGRFQHLVTPQVRQRVEQVPRSDKVKESLGRYRKSRVKGPVHDPGEKDDIAGVVMWFKNSPAPVLPIYSALEYWRRRVEYLNQVEDRIQKAVLVCFYKWWDLQELVFPLHPVAIRDLIMGFPTFFDEIFNLDSDVEKIFQQLWDTPDLITYEIRQWLLRVMSELSKEGNAPIFIRYLRKPPPKMIVKVRVECRLDFYIFSAIRDIIETIDPLPSADPNNTMTSNRNPAGPIITLTTGYILVNTESLVYPFSGWLDLEVQRKAEELTRGMRP